MSVQATAIDTISAGTYRNLVLVTADNHGVIKDTADVEVREGEVLGFSTIPSTGGSPVGIMQFGASFLLFIAGLILICDPRRILRARGLLVSA